MADRTATDLMFRASLQRVMSHSRLYPFIERHSLDVVQMLPGGDDFFGDTLRTDIYQVGNGGGAGAASPVITAGVLNGVCDFVTGTAGDSTASSYLTSGLAFRGDHACVFVAALQVDIITGVKIEAGFNDALTTAAVNVKSTPTFTASDCAVWCLDTNDNTYFEGLAANNGSTSPMATVKTSTDPISSTGPAPVAATYEWLMVELIPNDTSSNECAVAFSRYSAAGLRTFYAIGGEANPQGPNSDVLLTPRLYVEARNATSKTLRVDYWNAWQFRSAVV